ncbi:MAG: hypothetical protein VCB14_04410 [Alphaproteobacteria bacterium]
MTYSGTVAAAMEGTLQEEYRRLLSADIRFAATEQNGLRPSVMLLI